MRYLILVLLLTGCGTKQIVVIHDPLVIPSQCNFKKFTEEEKDSMTEEVGSKIYQNQERCRIRQVRIDTIIEDHNEAHKKKPR